MNRNFKIIKKNCKRNCIRYSSLVSLYRTINKVVKGKIHNGVPVAAEVRAWATWADFEDGWENEDIIVICERA